MNLFALTLIQLIIFTVYVGSITKKYGILPSISESWYVLPTRLNFLFTLFVWGISVPMFFYGNVWFALAASSLSFVGAATQFKMTLSWTKQIHYTGALLGILLSLVGILVEWNNPYPLILFLICAVVMTLMKIKNAIWWIEIAAFLTILGGLLIR